MYVPDGSVRCRGSRDVEVVDDDEDEVVKVDCDDVEEANHEQSRRALSKNLICPVSM